MSTVIFQVSRFVPSSKAGYSQLKLKERYNSQRDSVTALATLHMEEAGNPWLSGMHYAFIDDEGSAFYGFDKEDPDQRVDYNINFSADSLYDLKKQIQALGNKLSNPSKDENGVSELMGVQLHVQIKKGVEVKVSTIEPKTKAEEKWGTKLKIGISPSEVESVSIVVYGDSTYLDAPGQRMNVNLLNAALYKKANVVEAKPTTVEEAKSVLAGLTKYGSRKANKEAARSRQAGRGTQAIQPPAEPEKVTSRVLVADDEDDDQPE
jgi:hypothetical protein